MTTRITGDNLEPFIDRYTAFLALGDKALKLSREVNSRGKWRYDWRFMLPLGLPVLNNRTLEVMDFPPVSLLLETQDYLVSNTTNRWKALLAKNGVAVEDLDYYGAILDMVPIAAPAGDGKRLEEAEAYKGSFNEYAIPMLALWTQAASGRRSLPVMALGAPMREWFKSNFKVSLEALDIAELALSDGRKVPVMGSNHPSYFFYAANKYTTGNNKDEMNFAFGLEVMKQDIVAACWQAEMGKNLEADPKAIKQNCVSRWSNKERDLCSLVEIQAYKKSPAEAESICQTRKFDSKFVPSAREMRELERTARFN